MRLARDIVEQVVQLVSAATDIPAKRIMSHDRRIPIKRARWAVFYVLREVFGASYLAIQEATGFDHGTALHAIQTINGWPDNDPEKKQIRQIARKAGETIHSLHWAACNGSDVVLQHRKSGKVEEAHILQLADLGDGVKVRLNGAERGLWTSRREWTIIQKL